MSVALSLVKNLSIASFFAFCVVGCTPTLEDAPTTADAGSASEPSGTSSQSQAGESKVASGNESQSAVPIDATKFPKPAAAGESMYVADTSSVMFHQVGTVEEQVAFYEAELGKLGWKKEPSSEVVDGVGFLDFANGSLNITLTINPGKDGKIATIAQGSGIKVDESGSDQSESNESTNEETF